MVSTIIRSTGQGWHMVALSWSSLLSRGIALYLVSPAMDTIKDSDQHDLDLYYEAGEQVAQEMANQIDQEIIWSILKEDHGKWYEFVVPWTSDMRREDWDAICAWVVEQFGLPGDRYLTHPDLNEMRFLFKHAQDYEWMALRWS